ncbi:MAG TPA: DHA2 family efflux MFS transporter permease subunit [Chthonomonadaceae bacterium]|nr:DHA2 family efflux MFS transporter permease subunit [Chthonomonadaceae bacterium]
MATQTLEHAPRSGAALPKTAANAVGEALIPYRWIILIGLVLAAIMEVLDTTIVNVALPTMAGNLDCTTDEIAWVSTAYILANVVVLPMTAWLAHRFGTKQYLIASMSGFLVASVLCGLSHSLGEIVLWRLVQGAAGASLISLTQSTILQVFPKNQQDMVTGIWGLGIIVAPTVAPAFGGWLVDNYSWPWIFFVNIPIAFAAIFLVWTFLPGSQRDSRAGRVDYLGILLLAAGLGSIQYVLEEGNRNDWFSDLWILRLTILGSLALIAFIVWELSPRNRSPIVDLRVLKDSSLAAGTGLSLILGFGLYAGLYLFPIFSQGILGYTPTKTGLALLPGGAATGFGMIFCGAVMGRGVQPRGLVIFGMVTFIYSQWLLGHLSSQSTDAYIGMALFVRGFSFGFLFIPIAAAALAGLKGLQIPQGAALTGLARQLGGSFGIAIASTYISHMVAFHRTNLIAHLYSGSTALADRLQGTAQMLIGKGADPTTAQAAALKLLDGSVQVQTYTMSVNDAFLLIVVIFVVAFPSVFLLKRAAPGAAAAGAH